MKCLYAPLYAILACLSLTLNALAMSETPLRFAGTWEDSSLHERGTLTVTVTKESGTTIEGILEIAGSKDCIEPIPFRGARSEYDVVIIADTPGICGHNGVLSAIATKNGQSGSEHEPHTGMFVYRFFGEVWKKGTFELRPLEIPLK